MLSEAQGEGRGGRVRLGVKHPGTNATRNQWQRDMSSPPPPVRVQPRRATRLDIGRSEVLLCQASAVALAGHCRRLKMSDLSVLPKIAIGKQTRTRAAQIATGD